MESQLLVLKRSGGGRLFGTRRYFLPGAAFADVATEWISLLTIAALCVELMLLTFFAGEGGNWWHHLRVAVVAGRRPPGCSPIRVAASDGGSLVVFAHLPKLSIVVLYSFSRLHWPKRKTKMREKGVWAANLVRRGGE
ncbi:hypothetical protein H5410_029578 [Solanum commersonii]|uniref:Uncharacterized protein n=1 Tax=Solanum commersonii TaxID=4109 RepID=A0A9J5YF12_SOLCO|nr:hypothetical protein H5410_029578 [Solanum commersonii]